MGCNHHWIIEASREPEVEGQCYNCGEIRTFVNVMPDECRDAWGLPNSRWAPIGEDGLPRHPLSEGSYRTINLGGAE